MFGNVSSCLRSRSFYPVSSSVRRVCNSFLNYKETCSICRNKHEIPISIPSRASSGKRVFELAPSEYMNKKMIDDMHFFVMLGLVPCVAIAFLANLFVGRGELQEIPDGYEPRHWEYYQHPISRFMAKFTMRHPQRLYEEKLGVLENAMIGKEMTLEERWFRHSQREKGDYRGWFFVPANPVGVIRGRRELDLEEEIGQAFSR